MISDCAISHSTNYFCAKYIKKENTNKNVLFSNITFFKRLFPTISTI